LLQNGRVIRKKLLDAVPQPTEWQRIANQIDAAMVRCLHIERQLRGASERGC
jgi:hypothetical protein